MIRPATPTTGWSDAPSPGGRVRFLRLYAAAWVRGLCYRWPKQAPIPQGYSGVSCGLRDFAEVRDMWRFGWEPWCFQRLPKGYSGVARLFRVPLSEEQREMDEAMTRSYIEAAEAEAIRRHEGDLNP